MDTLKNLLGSASPLAVGIVLVGLSGLRGAKIDQLHVWPPKLTLRGGEWRNPFRGNGTRLQRIGFLSGCLLVVVGIFVAAAGPFSEVVRAWEGGPSDLLLGGGYAKLDGPVEIHPARTGSISLQIWMTERLQTPPEEWKESPTDQHGIVRATPIPGENKQLTPDAEIQVYTEMRATLGGPGLEVFPPGRCDIAVDESSGEAWYEWDIQLDPGTEETVVTLLLEGPEGSRYFAPLMKMRLRAAPAVPEPTETPTLTPEPTAKPTPLSITPHALTATPTRVLPLPPTRVLPRPSPPPVWPPAAGVTIVRGTWTWDIETDALGCRATDICDIWWQQIDSTARRLVALGDARIGLIVDRVFDDVDYVFLLEASTGFGRTIPGSDGHNMLEQGAVVGVRTREGNLAKLKVLRHSPTHELELEWELFVD